MGLTFYRVPREGGDPDPFTQAVSVVRIENKALTWALSPRQRAKTCKALASLGERVGIGGLDARLAPALDSPGKPKVSE